MIATFYSFKGGVGRSSALVEAAAQLARRGRSVIVWDLDLEAPGIQRLPALRSLDGSSSGGTLDLLLEFQKSDYQFPSSSVANAILDLHHPAVEENHGRLSFLLTGKLDKGYAGKFAEVDWSRLFAPREGPGAAFFHKLAGSLSGQFGYEYVLIDSRTGYTDLGAICTLQLPDLVVLVFNLNEQNLRGIEPVWNAVTRTSSRDGRKVPVFALANMIPAEPWVLRVEKLRELDEGGLPPHLIVPLEPQRLLTDSIPSLDGDKEQAEVWLPLVERIEDRRREIQRAFEQESEEKLVRARGDESELDLLRRRGIYERAKTFEEKVAELFRLLGYDAVVDYKRDDMQFDVRLEMPGAAIPSYVLVECKDTDRPAAQEDVRNFASKVEHARRVDTLPYQAILVARSRFANNAHAVAKTQFVQLRTMQELLLSLVDLGPNVDAAITGFRGTALERLYVEQDVVLQSDLQAGKKVERRKLSPAIKDWLARPGDTFLALLGDFGTGKTSFCRRLACELALEAREHWGEARIPILIDLRDARSTVLTLESILTHHFQKLSSKPFNAHALMHLNREGHLLLIFDGFDEIIGYSDPNQFAENLRQLLRAAEGRAKVLLTCRTHYFRDRPDEVRSFGHTPTVVSTEGATKLWDEIKNRSDTQIGYVLEFDESRIEQYLQKALPPPADWRAFREEIRHTYNLNDLAQRPFLLEIIVKMLPWLARAGGTEDSTRVKVTIADLYETYCEEWFAKTDLRLTLTRERKAELVEHLARLIWDSPDTRVHYQVLAETMASLTDRPSTVFEKERIDYEVRTALFLNRDAGGYYSFVHRSFLEFFVARSLRRALVGGEAALLDMRRLTREVVFFLEFWPEASRIPDLASTVLTAAHQPRVSENALLLLYWHACSSFGPLVGPGSENRDPFAIRRRFREIRPAVVHLDNADLAGAELRGIDLANCSLRGADLTYAGLQDALLDNAELAGVRLSFAGARRASFSGCDLSRASLDHLDGRRASFDGANLAGADLGFSCFVEASFERTSSEGTDWTGAGLLRSRGLSKRVAASNRFAGGVAPRALSMNTPVAMARQNCVAWSPKGRVLVSAGYDRTLKLWDAASGRLLRTLIAHTGRVRSVAWDAAGERLASGSDDGTVKLWNTASGRLLRTIVAHAGPVRSVAWDAAGERLASGSDDGTLKLWQTARGGRLLRTFEGHTSVVASVAWDAAGRRLASASEDGTLKLWDVGSGRLLRTFEGHTHPVNCVAWNATGQQLASASSDGTVKLWETVGGRPLHTFEGHTDPVSSVAWNPTGERLASASHDRTVKLWGVASGGLLRTFEHTEPVNSVGWDAGGERLASAPSDGTVKLWEPASGQLLRTLEGHAHSVSLVAWNAAGERLASASSDGTVKLWEMASGRLLRTLQGHTLWVNSVAWSPTGEQLASASCDGTVKLWELASGRLLRTFEGQTTIVPSVAWDAAGERLATVSFNGTVKVWEAVSGRLLRILGGHKDHVLNHNDYITSVIWDAAGERLATASFGGRVTLWEAASGQLLHTLEGHKETVISLAWDAAGERLASASEDETVRLWETSRGRLLHTLEGHNGSVLSVAWEPAGKRLASVDGTVKLWDAASGRLLHTLEQHSGVVRSVAWNPAGKLLAAASDDGSSDLIDLSGPDGRVMARLFAVAGGGLVVSADGYLSGDPEALKTVSFADGWALYDLEDFPERVSPEGVAQALRLAATVKDRVAHGRRGKKPARRARTP